MMMEKKFNVYYVEDVERLKSSNVWNPRFWYYLKNVITWEKFYAVNTPNSSYAYSLGLWSVWKYVLLELWNYYWVYSIIGFKNEK